MGNLKIDKINDTPVSEFVLRYPVKVGGHLQIELQSSPEGDYRIFNATGGCLPDQIDNDNDTFAQVRISEKNTFLRIDAMNVRTGSWYYCMKRNGSLSGWIKMIDVPTLNTALDLKVDKSGTKQLSDENFTKVYKDSVNELINTSFFRGYFDTILAVKAQLNPKNGWYCICLETKTIWYYNNEWKDLGNTNTGDMKRMVYDVNNKHMDVYDRRNHDGIQSISTIEHLQQELDEKLNIENQIKVIDNANSNSPIDALSARVGSELKGNFLDIISGLRPIMFDGKYEDNGYIKIGKLLVQWGFYDFGVYDNRTDVVNFNIPYPSKCFGIMALPVSDTTSGSGADSCSGMIIDNIKFNLVKDYATTCQSKAVYWLSWGI